MANGTVKDVNGESGALAVVGVQNSVEPLVRKRSRGVAELTDKTHAVAAGGGKRVKLSKKQSRNVSIYFEEFSRSFRGRSEMILHRS